MANERLQVRLDGKNLAIGVCCVILSLALFTWLLPLFLPYNVVVVIAAAALGIAAWFLFMISRS
jgi:hypothetical protein